MSANTLFFLATWTPYLFEGFLWNLLIAFVAVAFGTMIGAMLAWVRIYQSGKIYRLANFASRFFRNIPTLAFIFYAAFILPKQITIPGLDWIILIPNWLKASIGLSASSIGFTSESLVVAHRAWIAKDYPAALLFIPTWANSAMISFVASSTASLVGIGEIISRCNSLIAATGTSVMIPLYLYCGLYFVATCLLWIAGINYLKRSNFLTRYLENKMI